MNEAANELSLIRKYLLGGLKGEEREQLEERVLLDPEFKDRVLIVEENLIDEYAEGALDGEERQRFQMMFYSNPQRRLDVELIQGLQQRAGAKWTRRLHAAKDKFFKSRGATRVSVDTSASFAPLGSLTAFGKAAIAFALVVTVIFAYLIVQRVWRPEQAPPSLAQDQQRRELIERELARLNSRESQSSPAGAATTLSPGLSRGDESQRSIEFPTITLAHATESIQLKLLLRRSAHEYQNFQAVLTPVGRRESFKIDLQRDGSAGAPELVLTLPALALDDGDYRVQLSGQTADGQTEALSDHYYYFRLARQ